MIHNHSDFESVQQRRWRVEEERKRRERVKRHWDYTENRWVIEMCDGCDDRPATVDFKGRVYCDRCMEEISALREGK